MIMLKVVKEPRKERFQKAAENAIGYFKITIQRDSYNKTSKIEEKQRFP